MASRTNTASKLFALAVALLLTSLAMAACGDDDDDDGGGGQGDSGEPIVVGISAAKSGALEPYDLQGAQLLPDAHRGDQQGRRRPRRPEVPGQVARHQVGPAASGARTPGS